MRIPGSRVVAAASLLVVLSQWGCSRTAPRSGPSGDAVVQPGQFEPGYFEDVTPASGLNFTYQNGADAKHATILESLGGGVALIDFDGDGLLDIFVTGGGMFAGPDKKEIVGLPCKLYKNLGKFQFKDVTAEVGLDRLAGGKPWFYSHGCAVADYDNDGWPDLLVTGWGRVALFHNEPIDSNDPAKGRRFVDVSAAAGLDRGVAWATSAAFGDLDGDGFPDLYVCQYVNWSWMNNPRCLDMRTGTHPEVCQPEKFDALPDLLYHNNAGKSFTLVSADSGLHWPRGDNDYAKLTHLTPMARERLRSSDRQKNFGKGLGVLIADLNDDGLLDIFVANDTSGNFLYVNRGGGRFEEIGAESGIAYDGDGNSTGSMGIDVADYNRSGRPSIFVTNFQHQLHGLYRNRGNGQFAFSSVAAGLSLLGKNFVGFGTGFLDFDLDGNEDLFVSNGHVVYYPDLPAEVKQRPVLLRNERKLDDKPHLVRFTDVSAKAGPYFQTGHLGRGAALGDLDNDGCTDLVLIPANEPVVILHNRHETKHHWLGVELIGKTNRDAVGARVELELRGQKLLRLVKGGGSYLSAGDRRLIFGLGDAADTGRLTVRWPSGKTQTWEPLAIDRYWKLREGEPNAEPAHSAK
jgi:enediyne biosynthesis protein E4